MFRRAVCYHQHSHTSSHTQPSSSQPYPAADISCAEEGEGVRPGDGEVLFPPPLHHHTHVEAEHERDGDEVTEVVAVEGNVLEDPAVRGGEKVKEVCIFVRKEWRSGG